MINIALKDGIRTRIAIAGTGKSLREFARYVGISHSYLSQILTGQRNPSATVAYKISKGLNVEMDNIFLIQNVANDNL